MATPVREQVTVARERVTVARERVTAASCAALSSAAQFAAARLVFVGRTLPGSTVALGSRRELVSPARMRVERYLKGRGSRTVKVDTSVAFTRQGVAVAEDGIAPRAGERWKIYSSSRRQPFATSICLGSARVVGGSWSGPGSGSGSEPGAGPGSGSGPGTKSGQMQARGARAALALWRAFPAQAEPRPVVPLGEGLVIDPDTGFRTVDQKVAYEEGRFALRTSLPAGLATFGRFRGISAAAAFQRLRSSGRPQHDAVAPLLITRVGPGTATFLTDRGSARLPAWRFYFQGVSDPASVLALATPDLFIPPPLHRFGPPGPGNSIEDSATESASGTAITISFGGAPPGTAPCDASYRASAVADRHAVAFVITTLPVLIPAGQACATPGYIRTVLLRLGQPLGRRVLISGTDGGGVPVAPSPGSRSVRLHAPRGV